MKIPSDTSVPLSLVSLERNLSDVRLLLNLARQGANSFATKKAIEAVNRSAVVLTCASWETFVEDLAVDGLSFIHRNRHPADDLSPSTRAVASRTESRLKGQSNRWGTGLFMQKNRDTFLGVFNTPKAAKVDALFKRALGMDSLSMQWSWRRVSAPKARQRLDAYVSLRGDIAHRTKGTIAVTKAQVVEFVELCERLGWLSCNAVRAWLLRETSKPPWDVLPTFQTDRATSHGLHN